MKLYWVIKIGFVALFFLAALPSIRAIVLGGIPFWYDPARDLLAAQNNWQKPTLIGPPTGIPGIFYGPLWIWILSLVLKIGSDPAVIATTVLALPYLVFFPLIFWHLRKALGTVMSLVVGLTLFLSHPEYLTHLWNIYPSALVFLLIFFLVASLELTKKQRYRHLLAWLLGLSVSVLTNFHLSFAISVIFATAIFIAVYHRKIKMAGLFTLGIIIPQLPTLLFELRHGFHQVQLLISAVIFNLYADNQVYAIHGLSKSEIWTNFLNTLPAVFGLPPAATAIIFVLCLLAVVWKLRAGKISFTPPEKRLIVFLVLIEVILLISYLTTKNPVWPYHFISTEVPLLLITALIFGKSKPLRWGLLLFVLGRLGLQTIDFVRLPAPNYYLQKTLAAKKQIVENIYADARGLPFSWVAYETELVRTLTPDYDYLFAYYSSKLQIPLPDKTSKRSRLVYLIVYSTEPGRKAFFSTQGAPIGTVGYRLDWELQYPDGTWVLRKSL